MFWNKHACSHPGCIETGIVGRSWPNAEAAAVGGGVRLSGKPAAAGCLLRSEADRAATRYSIWTAFGRMALVVISVLLDTAPRAPPG
jgi:hypothetical protein